jgi:DNA-binding MarR family transcriptional regulator
MVLADREMAAANDRKLQLRVWVRLLTCSRMIEAGIRARLRAEFATTLARFDVLAQLDAARGELSMGELSARLMVTNGNVTGLIAGMEADGLVARLPHPTDGRSTLIGLTPEGHALFDHMAPAHQGWIEHMVRRLSPSEMGLLFELLGKLKDSVRASDSS